MVCPALLNILQYQRPHAALIYGQIRVEKRGKNEFLQFRLCFGDHRQELDTLPCRNGLDIGDVLEI